MRKDFLLFLLCLLAGGIVNANAQELVEFKLQRSGTFLTTAGEDYAVVEFQGKSAEELYKMVKDNVSEYYENPEDILTEEDNKLTVRGGCKDFVMWNFMMVATQFGAFYDLTFRFKDGRIRIDAPVVEDELIATASVLKKGTSASFKTMLGSFYKNGDWKEKAKPKITQIENYINTTVNQLLGLIKPETADDDDW